MPSGALLGEAPLMGSGSRKKDREPIKEQALRGLKAAMASLAPRHLFFMMGLQAPAGGGPCVAERNHQGTANPKVKEWWVSWQPKAALKVRGQLTHLPI